MVMILIYSTQGLAQKAPSKSRGNDEVKQRVSQALVRSKRITIKVNNHRDLSGAGMEREATGLVKSASGNCFELEYSDKLGLTRQDCIPFADATVVKWHAKVLHVLRLVGEDTALIVVVAPIAIPLVIITDLLGHPLFDC
jgi:hypothetical protein